MKYCIANWKMNFTTSESINFIKNFSSFEKFSSNTKVIFSPSFISLKPALDLISDNKVLNQLKNKNMLDVGAQDISSIDKGAYTGDVSAAILNDINCNYVIIGHSERRTIHNETNDSINKKLKLSTKHNLCSILCIGENDINRKKNKTFDALHKQLKTSLNNINLKQLIIAYEPVWAIGTGNTASKEIIEETFMIIKKILKSIGVKLKIPIIYGGSVNEKNIKELSNIIDIDGFLIGGASLSLNSFRYIYNTMGEK